MTLVVTIALHPLRGSPRLVPRRRPRYHGALTVSDYEPGGIAGPPLAKKKRKTSSNPTAASIAKQSKRLEKAREATEEAIRFEGKAAEALKNEKEVAATYEERKKNLPRQIQALRQNVNGARESIKHWKKEGAKFTAKARAERAKAKKLAAG